MYYHMHVHDEIIKLQTNDGSVVVSHAYLQILTWIVNQVMWLLMATSNMACEMAACNVTVITKL